MTEGNRVRIAVLGGAGAMGGLYGAWLQRAGHQVTLVDVAAPAVTAIRERGLRLERFDGTTEVVHPAATTHPEEVGQVDLVIVQVKGRHTRAAAQAARPLVGPRTLVLTLQNGWGNTDQLREVFGAGPVLAGVSLHSAGLVGPGIVKHSGVGHTVIGELEGPPTARTRAVAELLAGCGRVEVSTDIRKEIWTKLALNCACLAACALLRIRSGLMLTLESAAALMRQTTVEVVGVARAAGIDLSFDSTWHHIEQVVGAAQQVRCSMLQDVEAGRLTEIETINGAVVATADRHGVPTPINRTLLLLVRAHDERVARGLPA